MPINNIIASPNKFQLNNNAELQNGNESIHYQTQLNESNRKYSADPIRKYSAYSDETEIQNLEITNELIEDYMARLTKDNFNDI